MDLPYPPNRETTDTARITTLVYIMAENRLATFAASDLKEIKSSATLVPDDCNMLAFVDDAQLPIICRFYNKNGFSECDTVYKFNDDFCSSDTVAMREVFDIVLEKYPTHSMNLVMWSHGSGWIRSKSSPVQRSIGVDNEKNSPFTDSYKTTIEIEELATFIQSLPVEVELLMFDACFMQNVETAYALRNSAKWILASPAELPANGAPYNLILEYFFEEPFDEVAVENLMNAYYSAYSQLDEGVVLSVVRCSEMENLAEQTAIVSHNFSRASNNSYGNIFTYLPGNSYYPDYFDINAAMLEYLSPSDYAQWKEALNLAVPYKCASYSWWTDIYRRYFYVAHDRYSGISIYLPQEKVQSQQFNEELTSTEWYNAVGWSSAGW